MFSNYFKFVFVLIMSVLGLSPALAQDEFLDPEQAFEFSAAMATENRLDIHFKVAHQYYMYKDRFDFDIESSTNLQLETDHVIEKVVMPDGLVKYDITFEEDLEVYYGDYTLQVHLNPDINDNFDVLVLSQGCAEIGLCYSPTQHIISIENTATGYKAIGNGVVDAVPDISASTPASEYYQYQEAKNNNALNFANSSTNIIGSNDTGLTLNSNVLLSNNNTSNNDAISIDNLIQASDVGIAQYIQNAGLLKIVAICFLLGLLLSFTPCVLPMVPILLAVLTGANNSNQNSSQKNSNNQTINCNHSQSNVVNQTSSNHNAPISRSKGFGLAAVFVLGMSIVYTVLGVAAGVVGASLAAWLQKPWVLISFAVLLFIFALAMFDAITIQVPSSMQSRLNNLMNKIPGGRFSGVFVMGMLSALIVGPCVAAPLAGVLLFISQTGDTLLGATALFALAWGQGVLLLVVGASSGLLMLKAGNWMQAIKYLFGVLLLGTAWWMVQSVFAPVVVVLGWALIILFSALLLWNIAKSLNEYAILLKSFWQTIAAALALWSALIIIGIAMGNISIMQPIPMASMVNQSIDGNSISKGSNIVPKPIFAKVNSIQELELAINQSNKPLMLDFYADWCVSCIQMEKFTFNNPQVAALLSEFTLIQADVTDNTPQHQELLKRFNLFGPPGIMFFDASGQHITDVRVVGYKNAQQFAEILRKILI